MTAAESPQAADRPDRAPEEPQEYARRSARVVLLDAHDRVLLLQLGKRREWLTPGGGVDPGEHPRQAAVRELWEEVGLALTVADLGPQVAVTSGYVRWSWLHGLVRDDFFFHRVDSHRVSSPGLSAYERRAFHGHRWWSAAELAATTERVAPLQLGPLVARLAAGELPSAPVPLPWHH